MQINYVIILRIFYLISWLMLELWVLWINLKLSVHRNQIKKQNKKIIKIEILWLQNLKIIICHC
jgi:hypothetical protein